MEQTKLQAEISGYYDKIVGLSSQQIAKLKLKILEKLQKLSYFKQSGEQVDRDISNNVKAQARIKLRYSLLRASKRISGLLQLRGIDYDKGWRNIIQIFIDPSRHPDGLIDWLNSIQEKGLNFMDTLSLSALQSFGNYLTLIYDKSMFMGQKVMTAAYFAREEVNRNFENGFYASYYLPRNWKTIYKYISQLEILTEREKQFQRDVYYNVNN